MPYVGRWDMLRLSMAMYSVSRFQNDVVGKKMELPLVRDVEFIVGVTPQRHYLAYLPQVALAEAATNYTKHLNPLTYIIYTYKEFMLFYLLRMV
jgi:hypothetical protein